MVIEISKDDLRSKFSSLGWKGLFLLIILFVYLSIGALIFHILEYDARRGDLVESAEELEENRAQLLKVLWAGALAKSEDDWTLFANERMDLYESELVENVQKGRVDVKNPEESANPWSLEGSFFYCFTIVTTIGYGNVAPVTSAGKIATIIYGLIGIPITLYLLSVIGKLLTVSLKLWLRQLSSSNASPSDEFDFGPIMIILLFSTYFAMGSALFAYLEEWDYLDAGYFSFITFTTIGLGDMVPENLEAAILAIVFIFTALSLFSLIFNVFQELAGQYLDRLYAYFLSSKNGGKSQNSKNEKSSSTKNGESSVSGYTTTKIPQYQSTPKNAYDIKTSWNQASPREEEVEVEEADVEEDQT